MRSIRYSVVLLTAVLGAYCCGAQTAKELQETGRGFMQQGDFTNAFLVLNRASSLEPGNTEITKDLALNYYFQRDYKKGLEEIRRVLDRDDADDQCFQIAANLYKQLDQPKECEKIYRRGLVKFPHSGPLFNDLGELQFEQRNAEAFLNWEKGIQNDPNYSRNYYNASKYYFSAGDHVWSIVYGETFVNLDPLSKNSPEIKSLLLESYKRLFAQTDFDKETREKGRFTEAFLQTMKKQREIASGGINPETLTMIRTRFILDWFHDYAAKFPSRLFEQHRQLLQDGLFEAYNQWLFGTAQNLAAYQNWTTTHATEYNEFSKFQRGRIFKLPSNQYYH
jgi:tetratricopeptide (TPR) repeat protein